MYRLITFLFFLGIFLGPYIYILDSRIHLLRIFTPLVFILLFLKSKKISIELAYVIVFFITYYFYTILVSVPNYKLINFKDVINFTYIPVIAITSVVLLESNPKRFYKVLSFFLISFLALSLIIAIYEEVHLVHLRLSAMNEFPTIWDGYYHMPTAFFVNPNDLAVVYIMSSMFLMFYFKNNDSKASIILKAFLIISSIWIVFVTGSRINQISIILFLIVYFQIWKRPLSISIGISTLLVLLIVFFEFNPFDKIDFSYESNNSVSYRLALYQSSWKSITQNYGIGYGVNLSQYFYTYIVDSSERGSMVNPHSYLLELLINSGVLIFILYIILNVYILLKMIFNKTSILIITQFCLYNLLLFSSSSSLFLWPHYIFFVLYCSMPKQPK